MLQQTTVGAVRGRYEPFLRRFPDLGSLARAREESVLAAWSGLGYYARARNLRRAAREVVRIHAGRLPRELEALRALPGFGEYMAAAVAAIAFGARAPAADANVTRVLSRIFALGGEAGTRAHTAAVRARLEDLLARGRPGDITAALMDLGQLVCTPRRPACPACPLAGECVARRRAQVSRFPHTRERPSASRVFVAAALALHGPSALVLRGDRALLGGLWQFPSAEGGTPAVARRRLGVALARFGLRLDPDAAPAVTRHTIVHRHLAIHVYRALASPDPKSEIRSPQSAVRWLTPGQLDTAAIPTLTRKIAVAARFLPEPRARILGRHARPRSASAARGPR